MTVGRITIGELREFLGRRSMPDDAELRIMVNRADPTQHAVEGLCNAAAIIFNEDPRRERPPSEFAATTDELTVFLVLGEPLGSGSPMAWDAIQGY